MLKKRKVSPFALFVCLGLAACGGGGGGNSTPPPSPPPAATLNLAFALKSLQFSWAASSGATTYRLMYSPASGSAFTQVGSDLPSTATSTTVSIGVHRVNWPTARYALDACNSAGCTRSSEATVASGMLQTIGYTKASNTGSSDQFGLAVALSSDGNTLAVGARGEASSATGVNGNQQDNSLADSGAVYVFVRSGNSWSQQAYIKASNSGSPDQFGYSLALSADGNTLAVGALAEDSNATGINGDQGNDSATASGAVYVFARSGGTWSQQAYVKASNTEPLDLFGAAVSLSSDGNILAIGARGESSSATGVNGNQADNSANNAGAAYVFIRTGSTWTQQAYVKASNSEELDAFGSSVALSGDGNTLAVGAFAEQSAATGINGNQADNSVGDAGAVYVFSRSGAAWTQQAYVKASNTDESDEFGHAVALSEDGNTLAVSAQYQGSGAAAFSGAAYVFTRSGSTWTQQAHIKSGTEQDVFGVVLDLSSDGNTLAVDANSEDGAATGINGNQADNSAAGAGAAYVFTRSGNTWNQQAYVKASNTGPQDAFGDGVALSGDGNTLAVGAHREASSATGINGNQNDNSVPFAGAVYLY